MNLIAQELVDGIEALGLPWAVAYSGSKGVHVYGFTGKLPAADVREAARIVLDGMGHWQPRKAGGDNFFECLDKDPMFGFPEFSIEVFPKQDSLDGKDLGNLMRLPLGRNIKSADRPFFMDITGQNPYELVEADALQVLNKVAENL
jgi:hypothetical protein